MSRYIAIAHETFDPSDSKVRPLHPHGPRSPKAGKLLNLKVQPVVSLAAARLARSEES